MQHVRCHQSPSFITFVCMTKTECFGKVSGTDNPKHLQATGKINPAVDPSPNKGGGRRRRVKMGVTQITIAA